MKVKYIMSIDGYQLFEAPSITELQNRQILLSKIIAKVHCHSGQVIIKRTVELLYLGQFIDQDTYNYIDFLMGPTNTIEVPILDLVYDAILRWI